MEYKKTDREILIRLDDGDEIVSSLISICKKENIISALISGIGSARKAELAHYDTKEKKFNTKKFEGMLEIVSMNGNISQMNDQPIAHLHICISKHDYSTLSGHLLSAEVYPTCEIFLLPYSVKITKKHDDKTGINLQHF